MAKQRGNSTRIDTDEGRDYLKALQEHDRVVERATVDSDALPPGVTHVLIDDGKAAPRLIEKRKSFI